MNPDDFSWSEDQHVTVTNPTDQTYKFKVHNKDYELGAGRTAKMPGFIAWVFVYGLASQIAQAEGKFNRWNEEELRQEYYQKLVSDVDEIVQAVDVEPEPEIETLPEGQGNTNEDQDSSEDQDNEEGEPEDPPAGQGTSYTPDNQERTKTSSPKPKPKAKALRR